MAHDWYRNTTWDAATELTFNEKLSRARRKGEYLRCQANGLAATFPEVSLQLLDRWFALNEPTLAADAFDIRARALLALGRIEEAIEAYEAALAREAVFPNVQTNTRLDLPLLIATRRIRQLYPRAVELATRTETDESLMAFPLARFQCHAAQALISADSGSSTAARASAALALEAAAAQHSGFRHHPDVGLVGERDAELVEALKRIVG
jgi:tetratricopeptide (TPR) repeat protein